MNKCQLLTKEDEQTYCDYIEKNPKATFEHTLVWKNILERNFGFKPYYILYKNEEGAIQGVLPLFKAKSIFGKRLVSTPYAVYTGTITDDEEVRREMVNFSNKLAVKKRAGFLEIREIKEYNYPSEFKKVKTVFNFSLKLSTNLEEVWKTLPKRSVRWGIKKAQKSCLTWEVGNSLTDLNVFYNLFVLTRKFRGVPSYPYSYFKDIIGNFKVKIYTAKLGNKAIASIFLIYYKTEVRYAFAGAVHNKEMMSLQPYHLIIWEAIKDACLNGYTLFNLGGATLNTNDGGLYDFKKKWADTIIEIPSYYFLNKASELPLSDQSIIFKFASKVWKRLPISLIRLLSPKVIKQFV